MEPDSYGIDYNKKPSLKRRVILLVLGIIVGIGLVYGGVQLYHFLNRKTVTLKPINGTAMAIGIPSDNEESLTITKVLLQTESEKSVRLSPGDYAVTTVGEGYTTVTTAVTVTENMTITPPTSITYSDEKLADILDQEQAAINAAIPEVASGRYTVSKTQEQLYEKGEWYSGRLMPKNATTDDQLVVVLHKENGQWKIAAGPAMTLYVKDYPDVLETAIRTVNNNYNVEINEGAE